MSLRTLALAGLLLGAIGWWFSPYSPRVPDAPAPAAGADIDCPLPSTAALVDGPRQTGLPDHQPPFQLEAGTLTPLAGFSVSARVLGRRDYASGREADFSPTDLALGWQRMREDDVLVRLDITQSGRWYRYRWRDGPPIPPREIVTSSANMHMIPSSPDVARALRQVRPDDRVRIDGWLVQ
ncbi:MAG TPA: hypothetical protein PK743_14930, partial [Luteimonas sp.]|nr:hypothetical protein [Luteimonas sp.]